jgi:hypothetical protein
MVISAMEIFNRHERLIAAPPERIAPLVADFGLSWPAPLAPVPTPQPGRRYDTGLMVWEEIDRPGAARAFRVISPNELQAGHWFELIPVAGGTLLRHTVEGAATGRYETIWPDRIEPLHDQILEALLDNVQAGATGPGGPRGRSA